jgi:hypothetical protein
MEIKGVPFNTLKNFIKMRCGENELQKVLNALSEEDRKIVGGDVLVSNWFDFDIFVRFANAMVKELFKGDESILEEYAQWSVGRQLKGIYKIFAVFVSIESFVNKASSMINTYYRGAEVSARIVAPNKAVAVYKGYQAHQYCIELIMKGWIKGAFEYLGGRNCVTVVSTSLKEGKGYFELTATWE